MSISDMIVVMKDGIVQQIGKPQEVYDSPVNLFVARFLGTPPINLFEGRAKDNQLYIGEDAVLRVKGIADQEVFVGIRPEGFILQENGPLCCTLGGVEVMGRDISVVSQNKASLSQSIRAIVGAEHLEKIGKTYAAGYGEKGPDGDRAMETPVRFALNPHKVFLFDKGTEERIIFEEYV